MTVGGKVGTALDTCQSTREGVTLSPSGTTTVELTAAVLTFETSGEFPGGLVACKLKSVVGLASDVGFKVGGSEPPSVVGLASDVGFKVGGSEPPSVVGLASDVGFKVGGSEPPSVVGLGGGVAAGGPAVAGGGVAPGGGVPAGSGNMARHRSEEQHPTRQSTEPVQKSELRYSSHQSMVQQPFLNDTTPLADFTYPRKHISK